MGVARVSSLILAACACACGGDNDPDPELIPGGGITDPDIDGEVNVFVIDEDSDEPIEGAAVHLGELEGETDADGLFIATDVSGAQTITVIAGGYTPTTWVGVDGANVTIPIGPMDASSEVAQGVVRGTIDGWEDLAVPAQRANIAVVGYSANSEDNDPANQIPQPGDPAPNVCVNAGAGGPCNYTVRTRTGTMMIFALLGDIDAQMNVRINGFAYRGGVDVTDNDTVDGIRLDMVDDADLIDPDVSLPSAPAGTDSVAALLRIELGADGRLGLPVAGDTVVPVPDPSLFPGSRYDLVGVAVSDDPPGERASSFSLERDIESVASASVGVMLEPPIGIETDGARFAFDPVEEATVHIFGVADTAGGTGRWAVAIFDGSSEIELPPEVSLPDGELRFAVQAIEIPELDVQDFALDDLDELVTRVAADSVTFTH